jgi:hypothetical protein
MNTIIIVATTNVASLAQAQREIADVAEEAKSHAGLTDLRVTHFRADDGTITPAGMGDQTVSEITAPPVADGDPMAQLLAMVQSLASEVAALKQGS